MLKVWMTLYVHCAFVFILSSNWMDGPMSGVDPDQVENDAGSMWRTLYKLEKQFSENPNPLQMAKKVHAYVHVHYYILNLLCYCRAS